MSLETVAFSCGARASTLPPGFWPARTFTSPGSAVDRVDLPRCDPASPDGSPLWGPQPL